MLVSIITVCFNSEDTIRDTIESVLSQDYQEIEYLIVDGGSKDRTMSIVEEYSSRIHTIITEPDQGIYDAMNKGIALARGMVIGMLNSDDVYMGPTSITELISKLISSNTDSVFADLVVVDRKDTLIVRRYYDSSGFSLAKFRFGWMPAHPTFLAKSFIYKAVGKFSLEYKIAADFEMLIRILWVNKFSYTYLNKPVVRMRQGGISSSGISRRWILNCEIVKACRQNGIWTALPLLALKIPRKLLELLPGNSRNGGRIL
jgi:glycosyltransferase involved in cell wall biosynthesis